VDDSGHARIADFGLATVARNIDSMRSASQHGGSSRWTAPEVLDGGLPTKEMDVFSFAMVMIEVCRGRSTRGSDSLSFRINTDIHRGNSVRQDFDRGGYTGHNEWQASTTADTPNLDRRFVGVDATVLES